MKVIEYQIEAITNLHVGSGETNFGVVDRLVQKDAATGFPNINASSIKGALRELFDVQVQQSQMTVEEKNWIEVIFGSKPNDPDSREAGLFRFFDAYLLGIPVRSDKTPFLMGTCPRLIQDYIRFCRLFGRSLDEKVIATTEHLLNQIEVLNKADEERPLVFTNEYEGTLIEDFEKGAIHFQVNNEQTIAKDWLVTLLGGPVVLFADQVFMRLCDEDHLPVIARNNLTENCRNLWYEQVLPRFSRLYFFVMMPDVSKPNEKTSIGNMEFFFSNRLKKAGVVQLGANATVGYGYCTFTKKN